MSDVVATILLLALTVTLFASVFFFVNTFPHPPAQPANQFTASLTYSTTQITGINIVHLAGPTVAGTSTSQTGIYLQSAAKPFIFATPFSLPSGLNGSGVWSLGQTWHLNLTSYTLPLTDNVTVSIITQSQLLFRITIPGSAAHTPPIFAQAGTTPAVPAPNAAITWYVAINDPTLNKNSVFLNDSEIPGVTGTGLHQMSFVSTSGLWIYTLPSGATAVGTFYVFVNATDQSHLQNSIAIPVTISNGGSSGGGGGSSSVLEVEVTANNTAPVVGRATVLEATVTNTAGSAATVTVQFYVAGTAVGSPSSQGVSAGGSAFYTQSWTPSSTGTSSVQAIATETGSSAEGSFSVTVFPRILFIAHAYPAGSFPAANTSADIAQKLTADGFPFTTMSVACGTALPSAATMAAYQVVVIDFGSATGLSCAQVPPGASEQLKITTDAATTNFWLLGADAFSATACTSYSAAFEAQFGLLTSGTCSTAHATGSTLTFTASGTTPDLRSDGLGAVPGLAINTTFQASAAFEPYFSLGAAASAKVWLKDSGSNAVGILTNGSTDHEQVALGTDPTLITSTTPNGQAWGTGTGADAAVVSNAMDYLCGLSTPSTAGRGLTDFGIAGATAFDFKHGLPTQFYVAVRQNGPTSGAVFATLYVAGAPAYFEGTLVTGAATLTGVGSWTWIAFNWSAPAAGTYTLSIGLTSENVDMYAANNQIPFSVYNNPTTFT